MKRKWLGALGLVLSATLGCSSSSDPQPIESTCVDGATKPKGDDCNLCTCQDGAWTCSENTCKEPQCPAPRVPEEKCNDAPLWYRHPDTGGCCEYQSCTAPEGWFHTMDAATCMSLKCEPNSRVPAGDGCNECVCDALGSSWDCTEKDCSPPAGKACGYWQGGCGAGEYCAFNPPQACSSTDAPSVCRPVPTECQSDLAEVCGCNGETYANRCQAAMAGTGIRDVGPCENGSTLRPCELGSVDTCEPDEYCGVSGSAVPHCMPRPSVCLEQYAPVCGCDGQTYANACQAAKAGTCVSASGACGTALVAH